MTADGILHTIACAAEQEAAQVLSDADRDVEATLASARQLVQERVATASGHAEMEARREAARQINAVRLRLVHRRAELASGALETAFALAGERLDLLASGSNPTRWAGALERLGREGLALTGPGSVIETRAADAPGLALLARELDARVEPLDGPGVPAGVVIHSVDRRIEVDATIPTRLERARASLAGQLARSLGLEE